MTIIFVEYGMFVYAAFIAALAALYKLFGESHAVDGRETSHKTYVSFTKEYDTYESSDAVHAACERFDKAYESTFEYPESPLAALDLVRALYSTCEDALIACNDILLRMPNDLNAEREFVRSYEDLDRRMNELIEDAKARLGVFVRPGPMSSAYAAKKYRAANDVFS